MPPLYTLFVHLQIQTCRLILLKAVYACTEGEEATPPRMYATETDHRHCRSMSLLCHLQIKRFEKNEVTTFGGGKGRVKDNQGIRRGLFIEPLYHLLLSLFSFGSHLIF